MCKEVGGEIEERKNIPPLQNTIPRRMNKLALKGRLLSMFHSLKVLFNPPSTLQGGLYGPHFHT